MSSRQRVGIAEFRVAESPAVLVTYGLGSCLGISIYDPGLKLGGLAHTLLPRSRSGVPEARIAKFADVAIRLMVEELTRKGAEKGRLRAKLVGGANMFEQLHPPGREGVGQRNARAAREVLEEAGIPLVAEDVGGNRGRTVEFDLATGEMRIRTVRGGKNVERL